jgi:hypothetical protein
MPGKRAYACMTCRFQMADVSSDKPARHAGSINYGEVIVTLQISRWQLYIQPSASLADLTFTLLLPCNLRSHFEASPATTSFA